MEITFIEREYVYAIMFWMQFIAFASNDEILAGYYTHTSHDIAVIWPETVIDRKTVDEIHFANYFFMISLVIKFAKLSRGHLR